MQATVSASTNDNRGYFSKNAFPAANWESETRIMEIVSEDSSARRFLSQPHDRLSGEGS